MKPFYKGTLLALLLLLTPMAASAQNLTTFGNITGQAPGCSGAGAGYVYYQIPPSTSAVAVTLAGTWSGTVQFVASVDNVNWASVAATPLAGGSAVTSTTGPGTWTIASGGTLFVCVYASSYASGTVAVSMSSNLNSGAFSGVLPNGTAATTQSALDGSTKLATTKYVDDGAAAASLPVTTSTSGPVAISAAGYYLNNAAGALTYTLPTVVTGTIGKTYCFRNAVTKTGAITLTAPASTTIDYFGLNGSAAGTLVSSGAAGDAVCLIAQTTTQYVAWFPGFGSWTNN